MKIPLFSKLTAKSRGRKVVRASAARAARGHDDDYYEMEPNMKLSHAFMVVLILHIVAVGGIYAFNHINARKGGSNLLSNISGRIAQAAGGAPAAAPALPAEPVRQPGDADEPLPLVTSDSATAGTLVRTAPAELAPVPTAATKAEVAAPVVAVPTSVGYGSSMEGLTALLGMLASCASGLTVVGIDNGFGAAVAIMRMLNTRVAESTDV